ncbi:vacuolar sorting protein [Fistulina hepatica ATCC 64428]|nr:vacuolar sorting protein [Fistulina hepatica ATCC 64428]
MSLSLPEFSAGQARDYRELHEQVQTSVNLLGSLEAFLSTFQKDLSAVSGQISELQDRSKDIENRLKSRRRIEKPLSNLLNDVVIPPSLATLILDTDVGEPWIEAIENLEKLLETITARSRVKAARDLGDVAEGLRIVAATKIRRFFLALFQQIRRSVSTNMQVLQTAVLLKYHPLYTFLQRQADTVAHELQRSYAGAARVYYETGFRRYARSLGYIKSRSIERFNPLPSEKVGDVDIISARLQFAKIRGPGVTLAFLADDKLHKEPIEALFRSLLLVFMDNATAEYIFISSFFCNAPPLQASDSSSRMFLTATPMSGASISSMTGMSSINETGMTASLSGGTRHRSGSTSSIIPPPNLPPVSFDKEVNAAIDTLWKQVMDPVLEYCEARSLSHEIFQTIDITFVKGVLDPVPPVIPLLTMIRLSEDVVAEVNKRRCPPVESFVFALRLQLWPVFQEAISSDVEALKKLAQGTSSGGYFSRGPALTETLVAGTCERYAIMFNSFVTLTEQEEETMIFSNLLRLRRELVKIIARHTEKISDPISRSMKLASIYEALLVRLRNGARTNAHPKAQQEIAHWSTMAEEAHRKINSMRVRR